MPTIFDSHNLRMAAQRIAAAADDDAITIADARAMHKHLADVIAAHEQATSSAARRAAKLDKALSDPAQQPAIQYAAGALRRLGLDFVAASDANKLTDAMRAKNLDVATCRPNYATNLQALTDGTRTRSVICCIDF
jgi:UDP-N-acetylglucosamine enolpyruvyl transferase